MSQTADGSDRPIRILYVITDLETGGVPLHLHRLVTALDRTRFDPRVVSLSPPGPVTDMLEHDGVPTAACGATHAWDFRALLHLRRIMRRTRPDLVHGLLFHANIATRLVGPLAGIPASRIINEIQTVEIERTWHLVVDQLTHSLCRVEIGNSGAVVDHLVRGAGIPREHVVCIPGGINPRCYQGVTAASRAELGVPEDAKLVIWVGRMDPIKRLEDLVEAFSRLDREPPAHLLLVGDGPERGNVEARVRKARLQGRVHLTGFRRDVRPLLAAADLFAFPSLTEGMPNALLEAMATGLPVVTCDVPGCRDLISHLNDGLLVPPASPEHLAGAMRLVLRNAPLGKRIGGAARRKALADYTESAALNRYADLYRRCLS